MTTLAHQQNPNRPNILAGFIVFLATIALLILVTTLRAPSPAIATVKSIPQIQYQPHAVEKHGSDT